MELNPNETSDRSLERQMERLQSIYHLSDALTRAEALEDIYSEALEGLQNALQVDRSAVLLVDAEGTLRFKAWRSLPPEFRQHVEGHAPWLTAERNPQPVFVSDIERDPHFGKWKAVYLAEGLQAVGFLPLVYQGRRIGKLVLYYNAPHTFEEDERQTSQTIAGQIAFALERKRTEEERAQLLLQEQQARMQAEAAQERLKFLLDANSLLSSTLDYTEALRGLAHLIVRNIADLCLVDMLQENGSIQRMAAVHRDPEKAELAEELSRRYPPVPEGPHPAAQVMRTGQPMFQPEMNPEFIKRTCQDDEHVRIVEGMGFKSYISVPLIARDRVLGALTLVSAETHRRYTTDDLALAENLARRAAVVIDNVRLYQEVQRTNRTKDAFLAMLGHELRNPLAPLLNALYVLKMRGSDPGTLEKVREVMDRQVRHMARIIDDLLDASRISRGKIELRVMRVDLAKLVRDAGEDHRKTIENAGLTLNVEAPDTPVPVQGDPTRLSQVVGNLLQNATKFTPSGGTVTVGLTRDDATQRAVLSVTDTGIGMDGETLAHVFETYAQGDGSAQRGKGGLGLGLALVKGLVELHQGAVRAKSEGPGRGSEFRVSLPLQETASPAGEPAPQVQDAVFPVLDPEAEDDEEANSENETLEA